MVVLIFSVIIAAFVAFFATQNTAPMTLHFGNYLLANVPVYGVIIGTLLFGLLVAWVINILDNVSSGIALYGKDRNLGKANDTISALQKKIYSLQRENEQLMQEKRVAEHDAQREHEYITEAEPTVVQTDPQPVSHRFFGNLRNAFH